MEQVEIKDQTIMTKWEITQQEMNEYPRDLNESRAEPEVCKFYGCGRTLTLRERLFGSYCINHQKETR